MVTGSLFAFIILFDELVIPLFLSDAQATLSMKMFENVTFAIDPTIAVIPVLKMLAVFAILLALGAIARGRRVSSVAA